MQMVIAEADVPSLSKGTHAGSIEFTTYATPGLKQQMANLVQGEHLPRYTEHDRRVQRIWGSACDALLSDEAAMSWVQVWLLSIKIHQKIADVYHLSSHLHY